MIKLRPANSGDTNFILATWLKSNRECGITRPVPESRLYYQKHQAAIKDALEHSTAWVATSDDDDQILGYVVHSGDCAHYVYVKTVFRKYGLANKLLDQCGKLTRFSHVTKYTQLFKRRGLTYDPYCFYQGVTGEDRNHEAGTSAAGNL